MTEQQALHKAAAYCSKAERCVYDVRKKLEAWKIDDDGIGKILSRLIQENFLNEERFCQSFVKDKIRFNKWGKTKIRFELKRKLVAEKVIETTLNEYLNEDFEEHLLKILTTKLPTIKANNEYDRKAKLYRFALGRGYSSEQIETCIRKILTDNSSNGDYS